MAFFFAIRRSSLGETYQRRLRTSDRTRSRITVRRKRLSKPSCDSLGRKTTFVN